jgi:hypothetical protein
MTTEIQEGNEKIARFENLDIENDRVTDGRYECHISSMRYDESWEMLIPVVQKIDALWNQYDIKDWRTDTDQYKYLDVISLPIGTPIMEVWEKVVKFIDWYTSNTEKSNG